MATSVDLNSRLEQLYQEANLANFAPACKLITNTYVDYLTLNLINTAQKLDFIDNFVISVVNSVTWFNV